MDNCIGFAVKADRRLPSAASENAARASGKTEHRAAFQNGIALFPEGGRKGYAAVPADSDTSYVRLRPPGIAANKMKRGKPRAPRAERNADTAVCRARQKQVYRPPNAAFFQTGNG